MFIFTSIFMVSLSAVLYLVVRTLPRIAEEQGGEAAGHGAVHPLRSHIPEKIDVALNGFLLKSLRKLKVLVLKIDNSLSRHLQRVKPEENGKKPSIDFKEIAEQNKEGQNGNA